MLSWASASNSSVLTPGATAARSTANVSATTSPAWRINCNCAGVLIWIMRLRPNNVSTAVSVQRLDRPFCDVIYRSGGVDADEEPTFSVERNERCCLRRVHLEPMPDSFGLVIVALKELSAALIAAPLVRGRVEIDVPDVPAVMAGAPPGEPPDDFLVVHDELQHHVQAAAHVLEGLLQRLGLRDVAREAVEQEP